MDDDEAAPVIRSPTHAGASVNGIRVRSVPGLGADVYVRLLERDVRRDGGPEEFASRRAELERYVRRSSGRLAASLAAVRRLGLAPGARVLELGADPWLFTQLLAGQGIVPVSAGQRRGVWREDDADASPQRVAISWNERTIELEHHLFNAERDRWPFADESFDAVVCMEVLEHLVYSPGHLLYEAARVLVSGGALLLTTPNAVSATRLARLVRGRNVHGPYSGYGAQGRHNREFTAAELGELLRAAGFEARVETINIAGYEADDAFGRVLRAVAGVGWRARRDHLLAVARKVAAPRLAFPQELYRSVDRDRMRAESVVFPDE